MAYIVEATQFPHEFDGEYRRLRGERRTYRYFASIFGTSDGYRWTAEIWCNGKFKGTLRGKIGFRSLAMAEVRVNDKLFHRIENLIDIIE